MRCLLPPFLSYNNWVCKNYRNGATFEIIYNNASGALDCDRASTPNAIEKKY